MLRYSDKATPAVAYLFSHFNDIDVFVEDTTIRNVYETLLNRMLPEGIKVQKVFQIGNKESVIHECEKQKNYRRPSLFIIDGDFDSLFNAPLPKFANLYRLNAYCIENLLVTKESVLEIAYNCLPNKTREELIKILNFDAFVSNFYRLLYPLILLFVVGYLLDTDLKTVSFNITSLIIQKEHSVELSKEKISRKIHVLSHDLMKTFGQKRVLEIRKLAKKGFSLKIKDNKKYFCGKTYLLPYVFHFLKNKAGYYGNMNQLKVSMANYCNLNVESGLRNKVIEISRKIIV